MLMLVLTIQVNPGRVWPEFFFVISVVLTSVVGRANPYIVHALNRVGYRMVK